MKLNSKKNNRFDTLGPCGVYCGACPSFDKTCKGCASEDKDQDRRSKWGCLIRDCCYNQKGLDYCIYCEQFPCKMINKKFRTHQGDPRYKYRHEIPDIFSRLKNMDIDKFLDFQRQRWKCNECNGTVQFYSYKCNKCGKEQMIK